MTTQKEKKQKKRINYLRSICSNFHQQMEVTQLLLSGPKFVTEVATTLSNICCCIIQQSKDGQDRPLLPKLHIFSITPVFCDIFQISAAPYCFSCSQHNKSNLPFCKKIPSVNNFTFSPSTWKLKREVTKELIERIHGFLRKKY